MRAEGVRGNHNCGHPPCWTKVCGALVRATQYGRLLQGERWKEEEEEEECLHRRSLNCMSSSGLGSWMMDFVYRSGMKRRRCAIKADGVGVESCDMVLRGSC